jgi:hypothetical protein
MVPKQAGFLGQPFNASLELDKAILSHQSSPILLLMLLFVTAKTIHTRQPGKAISGKHALLC